MCWADRDRMYECSYERGEKMNDKVFVTAISILGIGLIVSILGLYTYNNMQRKDAYKREEISDV